MKILVVTNLYPPHHLGGYELGCRDIVEKLMERGHIVRVLTSSFRNDKIKFSQPEIYVERVLQFNTNFSDVHSKWSECRKLAHTIKKFSPDIIYFSNQAGLSHWLSTTAQWHGCRTAFFLSDTSFISWRIAACLVSLAQNDRLLSKMVRIGFGNTFLVRGWPVIQNQPCHFVSKFLINVAEKNGIQVQQNSIVVPWGVNLAQFAVSSNRKRLSPPCRLLYVGRISPQKGIHTAIAAFKCLLNTSGFESFTLTLVGGGPDENYKEKMQKLVGQLHLNRQIHFMGELTRSDLPRIYAEHDALIFPSEWEEPFAITPLEAMASGLAVIGTTTGGSGELFRDRQTALTFRAGDAEDCARAIRELAQDRELFETISRRGQAEVRKNHSLDIMVAAIEKSLQTIISDSQK